MTKRLFLIMLCILLSFSIVGCTPKQELSITQNPESVSVYAGDSSTASFSVAVAGGEEPYTYQWYCQEPSASEMALQENSLNQGVTTANLTLVGFWNSSDNTLVWCVVTDAKGASVTSEKAVIKVSDCVVTVDFDNGLKSTQISVEYGTAISQDKFENTLEVNCFKEGCLFTGWSFDGQPFDKSTKITDNITIKAEYKDYVALLSAHDYAGFNLAEKHDSYSLGSWTLNPDEKTIVHNTYGSAKKETYSYSRIDVEKATITEWGAKQESIKITFTMTDGKLYAIRYFEGNEVHGERFGYYVGNKTYDFYYPEIALSFDELLDQLDIGESWYSITDYKVSPDYAFDKENKTITYVQQNGSSESASIYDFKYVGFFTYEIYYTYGGISEGEISITYNQFLPYYLILHGPNFEIYTAEKYQS